MPITLCVAFLDTPFRWMDPTTWPWFVYVWLALASIGPIQSLWRWLQGERVKSWPSALGRIEGVHIDEPGFWSRGRNSKDSIAVISFSYSISGNSYHGEYKRRFSDEQEALEFIRGLYDQPVPVQYHPNRLSTSALLDSTVEDLLKQRPLAPPADLPPTIPVPAWQKLFLLPFAGLSVVGFVLSLWVHINALFGRIAAPSFYFWGLHVGIFVVWFPAIFAMKSGPDLRRGKDLWRSLKGYSGLQYVVGFFFYYAIVNFVIFWFQVPSGKTSGDPPALVWRGFSGHWMLFYSAAFAMLYASLRPLPPPR